MISDGFVGWVLGANGYDGDRTTVSSSGPLVKLRMNYHFDDSRSICIIYGIAHVTGRGLNSKD